LPHLTVIKVRGYHCDFYGHVNNARYLELMEEARWQYLEAGMGLEYWSDRGLGFVVAGIEIKYKRPANPGMDLEISTKMTETQGRMGLIHQVFTDQATGKIIVDALVTFAVIDLKTGRAVPMEGEVKAGFDLIRAATENGNEE